jgi:hypothetical protein
MIIFFILLGMLITKQKDISWVAIYPGFEYK